MFPPVTTDRLVVRAAVPGDLEALFHRRNHPDTARFQSWSYPYSRDAARNSLRHLIDPDGPFDDEWWLATIVERGAPAGGNDGVVGDVAVHLSRDGRAAELGYTLDRAHWGRGYATEALAGMVDHLIDRGVRRFSALTHPDNLASMRVLERVGFRHEGRTVGSGFDGRDHGAPAADDELFGLTADGRNRWLARPTCPPRSVALAPIDRDNLGAVAALATHHSQTRLVAPMAVSLSEIHYPPVVDGVPLVPDPRAIVADDGGDDDGDGDGDGLRPVGFVMTTRATERRPEPYLWRLLVDRDHQGRGIGSAALDLLEAELATSGHDSIRVHWAPGPGSPEPFYRARGYEPTGEVHDGEVEARKRLG